MSLEAHFLNLSVFYSQFYLYIVAVSWHQFENIFEHHFKRVFFTKTAHTYACINIHRIPRVLAASFYKPFHQKSVSARAFVWIVQAARSQYWVLSRVCRRAGPFGPSNCANRLANLLPAHIVVHVAWVNAPVGATSRMLTLKRYFCTWLWTRRVWAYIEL